MKLDLIALKNLRHLDTPNKKINIIYKVNIYSTVYSHIKKHQEMIAG